MPRDANGNYTLPAGNPVISGTTIDTSWANPTMADLGNEITNSLSRTGEGGMLVPFQNIDGAVGTPGITWRNETVTGFYRAGTNDMRVAVGAVDKFRWTFTGVEVWDTIDLVWKRVLVDGDLPPPGVETFNTRLGDVTQTWFGRNDAELVATAGDYVAGQVNTAPFSSLTATEVQSALEQLEALVEGLAAGVVLQGTWDAATNTPDLLVIAKFSGNYWIVSVAGTTPLPDGEGGFISSWAVGDRAIYINQTTPTVFDGWVKIVTPDTLPATSVTFNSSIYDDFFAAPFPTTVQAALDAGWPLLALAETALQIGDNVSDLVNDAGYLVAASAVTSFNLRTGAVVSVDGDYQATQVIYDNLASGLTATRVQAAIDELAAGTGVVSFDGRDGAVVPADADYTAALVVYNNATSGLTATRVQAAIDEVDGRVDAIEADTYVNSFNARTGAVVPADADYTAALVVYSNATSGLTATRVQAAIDEVDGRVDAIEADTYVNSFNARTGAVLPVAGDYTAIEVDYDNALTPAWSATEVQSALVDAYDDIQFLSGAVVLKGVWDALNNVPDIGNVAYPKTSGNYWIVSVEGSTVLPLFPTAPAHVLPWEVSDRALWLDDGAGATGFSQLRPDVDEFLLLTGGSMLGQIVGVSPGPVAAGDLTRKDYVDNLDGANVKLTGAQTVNGIKTFTSNPLSSSPQSASITALTRKDYVDTKLPLVGGTVTGQIVGIPPVAVGDLTRKDYVDNQIAAIPLANYLLKTGGTVTGQIVGIPPVAVGDLTRKDYVDNQIANASYLPLTGGTLTGALNVDTGNASSALVKFFSSGVESGTVGRPVNTVNTLLNSSAGGVILNAATDINLNAPTTTANGDFGVTDILTLSDSKWMLMGGKNWVHKFGVTGDVNEGVVKFAGGRNTPNGSISFTFADGSPGSEEIFHIYDNGNLEVQGSLHLPESVYHQIGGRDTFYSYPTTHQTYIRGGTAVPTGGVAIAFGNGANGAIGNISDDGDFNVTGSLVAVSDLIAGRGNYVGTQGGGPVSAPTPASVAQFLNGAFGDGVSSGWPFSSNWWSGLKFADNSGAGNPWLMTNRGDLFLQLNNQDGTINSPAKRLLTELDAPQAGSVAIGSGATVLITLDRPFSALGEYAVSVSYNLGGNSSDSTGAYVTKNSGAQFEIRNQTTTTSNVTWIVTQITQ